MHRAALILRVALLYRPKNKTENPFHTLLPKAQKTRVKSDLEKCEKLLYFRLLLLLI